MRGNTMINNPRKYTTEDAIKFGKHIAETHCTIRQCASYFNASKSSVFVYIKTILPDIDEELSIQVEAVLRYTKEHGHHRGGVAASLKRKLKI